MKMVHMVYTTLLSAKFKYFIVPIGPLHNLVTWYNVSHAGMQVNQWDIQNKQKSSLMGVNCFVLDVSLHNMQPSMADFVPHDQVIQRAY